MKKEKRLFILFVSLIVIMLLLTTVVYAGGLKAEKPNGSTIKSLVNQTAIDFFTLIKGMKSLNGTLGVASNASKIDCHMAKNTEWGTAAMLGVSKYGQAQTGTNNASTTNNNTGVFQMADETKEYVAGVYEGNVPTGVDAKYFNVYTSAMMNPKQGFPGDALSGASGFVEGYGINRGVDSNNTWYIRSYNYLLEARSQGRKQFGLYGVACCRCV